MKAKHARELRRISESIPAELLTSLMKKETIAPTIHEILRRGLLESDEVVTPEQKNRFRLILESGIADREIEVIDGDVEKLIDAYVTAEVDLAVKLGRLPKKAPQMKLTNNKGKQYARRQAARLKTLQDPSSDTQISEGSNTEEDAGADRTQPNDD